MVEDELGITFEESEASKRDSEMFMREVNRSFERVMLAKGEIRVRCLEAANIEHTEQQLYGVMRLHNQTWKTEKQKPKISCQFE